MSVTPNNHIIYKLYDVDNTFIRVLDEVSFDLSVEKNIFSGLAPITLQFKVKVDELSSDITFNNKIKIYLQNKWNSSPVLIYYGYIVNIEQSVLDNTEVTGVTCLSSISKLKNDYLRINDIDLSYEIAPGNIGIHIKTMLEHYRATLVTEHGSADRSMIADPDDYWADTSYIEDTTSIGEIPYRYFNSKHLDAIQEIGKFLPKNDSISLYWYWFLNAEGRFILKKLSATADHKLIVGKHCTFTVQNNIESVINRIYFWNEQGDFADEGVRTQYEDTTSQNQYDVIADQISDSQITTYTQSRLLAEGQLNDRKDNSRQATITVNEAEYDILSFRPGEVVKIMNLKDEDIFASRMIITKVIIQKDIAVLSLSTPRPDLTTQIETDREYVDKQLKWFGSILTKIDGSRIYSGVQHWTTEDIAFDTDGKDAITWTAGTFILPNDVRRVVTSGNLTSMDPAEEYYIYIDEENKWCTKDTGDAAITNGTGSIAKGENFLIDSNASWTTDEYKGYVLWVNPAVGSAQKYIITRNTTTVIYLEGGDAFDEADESAAYEIHKFVLKDTSKTNAEGTADSGSTTTLVDSARTEGNDHWEGYRLKILSGDNAGMTRIISDFSSNTFTFSALPFAIAANVNYSIFLGAETQIVISAAKAQTDNDSEATIIPQLPAVYPEYQATGSTQAYLGLNTRGDLIKEVINDKLNTSSQNILADFDFGSTDYAGAVKTGDITWDGSGNYTSGQGVAIYRKGIIGADGSNVTFSIDTNGDATFAGTVTADAIMSANIDASQITTGSISIGYTDAKCTNADADETAANTAADIVNLPATPAGSGLYANGTHLGYYDGSSWKSYIDSDGKFYFEGNASNYIEWNGSTLTVRGSLDVDDVTAGSLSIGYTDAKCTDADADETSANKAADSDMIQGETIIDGDYIKTGIIDASRIDTGTLAADMITIGSASSFDAGYDPTDKLDSGDVGDMAYYDEVKSAMEDETLIVGGYLNTIFIDADYITAGVLSGIDVESSDGNDKIVLDSGDKIYFYNGGTVEASLRGATEGGLWIENAANLFLQNNKALYIQDTTETNDKFGGITIDNEDDFVFIAGTTNDFFWMHNDGTTMVANLNQDGDMYLGGDLEMNGDLFIEEGLLLGNGVINQNGAMYYDSANGRIRVAVGGVWKTITTEL